MNAATSIWPPLLEILKAVVLWLLGRGKTKADKLTAWRTEFETLQDEYGRAVAAHPCDTDRIAACGRRMQKHKAKRPRSAP